MIYIFKKELYTFKARRWLAIVKPHSRGHEWRQPLPLSHPPPPKKYDLLSVPIYLMYR